MILYETKYLSLKAAKREGSGDWVYACRTNASNVVVILPVIKKAEDEIVFLITKRPPLTAENVAEFSVEIPAGLVGDENENETIEDALKKELLEETGLVADSFKICAKKVSTSGGLTSETSTIAIATVSNPKIVKPPVDDGGVIVDRVYVKRNEIKTFLKECENKGYALSAQTLAGLYYLE